MGIITGVLQSIERKPGQSGDYAKANIDGQWISFFPPSAEAALKIAAGSTVQAEFIEKGKYKNGKSITLVGGPSSNPGVGSPQTGGADTALSQLLPKGGNESMILSYVKDLMVTGIPAKEAVDAIFEAYDFLKQKLNPTKPSTT